MGTPNIRRIHIVGLAASLTLVGCASIHDCKYETTQRIRTGRAWLHYNVVCPGLYSSAFSHGWKAGYYDVLTGNDGCPPLFAPERYSAPCKILKDCDKPRNDWYTGFQSGAACAQNMPDTHYMKPWQPPVTAIPAGHAQFAVPEVPEEVISSPELDDTPQSDVDLPAPPPRLPPPADESGLELLPPETRNRDVPEKAQEDSVPREAPSDADTYEQDPPKPKPKPVSQIPVLNLERDDDARKGNEVKHGYAVQDANRCFRRSSPWIRTCFPAASVNSLTATSFETRSSK